MKRTLLAGLLCALSASPFTAWAGEPPASLKLSQAQFAMPALVVYLDVLDAEGLRVSELRSGQFTASLGGKMLPVEQIQAFGETGEGVAYIFLVDVSQSVKSEQFGKIRSALSEWVDALSGQDRIAVLSFGETVSQVADFTADKSSLKLKIHDLKPLAKQTALHQGLIQAMQMGRRADAGLPGRRVIVVLSDGLDDLPGGPTQSEVLRQMEPDRVPIYAMGLDKPPVNGKRGEGSKTLGLFARSSGGDYVGVGNQPIGKVYADLRAKIKAVAVARLDCKACLADGLVQRLQITLQEDGLALSDGMDVRALPPVPTSNLGRDKLTPPGWVQPWVYFGLASAGLLLAAGFIYTLRRKPPGGPPWSPLDGVDAGKPGLSETPAAFPGISRQPAEPQCRVKLVELGSSGHGKAYALDISSSEAVIGRKAECAVSIASDTELSARHCALFRKGKAIYLHDLGSTNGTRVNGVPITSDFHLQEGDIIGAGRTELRILM